jgi:LmbE family N-acetylglucosaminyl deacetylase
MNKIIVIAPHPDDETLGCGGTLLKHKYQGDEINWVILTNISQVEGWSQEKVHNRQLEIDNVAKTYGFNSVEKLDFPTTQLDTIPMSNLIGKISKFISKIEPHTIYLNFHNDVHTDHQMAFQAVMSCTKNFRYPFIRRILMYETLSETEFAPTLTGREFKPNVFVDITDFLDKKIEIMKIFESEVMEPPYPRSLSVLEAFAKYRGSRIGVEYAESFMLLYEQL